MNRLRQFAFPLSLAVILGALSAWLGQVSQISIEEVPLNTVTWFFWSSEPWSASIEMGWLRSLSSACAVCRLPAVRMAARNTVL